MSNELLKAEEKKNEDILASSAVSEASVKMISMADVPLLEVEWLWKPYIPFGKVTIIQGNPGEGKTTLALRLASACSKGEAFHKMEAHEPFNVIYQTAEDGLGDTIKPRLIEADADLSRVFVIDEAENVLSLLDDTVNDHVWVTVLALSLASITKAGVVSMVIGALCVFIPQMAMALIPPHKTLGGADIKLSTALAFLLGAWKGIGACILGLVIAVVFISIYNKVRHRCKKKPFALVPFLSVGALVMFLT